MGNCGALDGVRNDLLDARRHLLDRCQYQRAERSLRFEIEELTPRIGPMVGERVMDEPLDPCAIINASRIDALEVEGHCCVVQRTNVCCSTTECGLRDLSRSYGSSQSPAWLVGQSIDDPTHKKRYPAAAHSKP